MRTKVIALAASLLLSLPAMASGPFNLDSAQLVIDRESSTDDVIAVTFSGARPAGDSPYMDAKNWKVEWQKDKTDKPKIVNVAGPVAVDEDASALQLHVSGKLPPEGQGNAMIWTVLFVSDEVPWTKLSYSPAQPPVGTAPAPSSAGKTPAAGKSCDLLFCPPTPTTPGTPDLSFSGNFLTAGGTNPLYQFEVKGGVVLGQFNDQTSAIGVNTQVEINQNSKPPVHRTRFDPDSITAGLALTHLVTFPSSWPLLNGLRLQAQAPEGEFSRSNPSSSIIASGLVDFDLKPWQSADRTSYFVLYPFLGFEAGRNLNRPRVVEKVPVDLSHYQGIVRGYLGADAKFGVSMDKGKSETFSITGIYRVRIPAIDEPFIQTVHEVTTIELTTRPRHWVEADVAYTPPNWKYLSLAATYQYGDLPPFFSFVDHKLTVGIKLQAIQIKRDKPLSTKLVQ